VFGTSNDFGFGNIQSALLENMTSRSHSECEGIAEGSNSLT
jgi:hypothetical protein